MTAPSRSGATIARLLVLVAAAIAVILVPFLAVGAQVDSWAAGEIDESPAFWAGLVVFALLAGDVLLPVPSSLVAIAAGSALGALLGTLVVATAMTVGCALGFVLAGRLGSPFCLHVIGPAQFARTEDLIARFGVPVLVVCRPVPVLAEASVLVAGAARLPLREGLFATGPANVGIAAVYASLGSLATGPLSVLVVFAGACILPAGAWLLTRRLRSAGRPRGRQGRRSVSPPRSGPPSVSPVDGAATVLSSTSPGLGARRLPRQ